MLFRQSKANNSAFTGCNAISFVKSKPRARFRTSALWVSGISLAIHDMPMEGVLDIRLGVFAAVLDITGGVSNGTFKACEGVGGSCWRVCVKGDRPSTVEYCQRVKVMWIINH